jgi:hypothetical protein
MLLSLMAGLMLASTPTLDAPRASGLKGPRLLAQAEMDAMPTAATLAPMRADIERRTRAATGPAVALLTIFGFPNLISGVALSVLGFGFGAYGVLAVIAIVGIVRIGGALAMWIAAIAMGVGRNRELEAIERDKALPVGTPPAFGPEAI